MEILQDTIIKLIVRQGPDSDRKQVVLTSGEHGYTTDTKRVFIGDGIVAGGKVVGNLGLDNFTGTTPPSDPVKGDIAFNTDTRKLYKTETTGTIGLSGWREIGGVYVSGDNKIAISSDNEITLNTLSAGSISPDLVVYPLFLSAGKIVLPPLSAYTVSNDLLQYPITLSGGKISLPPLSANTVSNDLLRYPLVLSGGKISLPPLSANTVSDDLLLFPLLLSAGKIAIAPLSSMLSSDVVEAPIYINNGKIALSANIPFERVSTKTITASSGLLAYVDGVNQGTTPINPLSANIVLQSNQLSVKFNGLSADGFQNIYTRGISGVRINQGNYVFYFGPLATANIYPFYSIESTVNHNYVARTVSNTVSSLSVTIFDVTNVTPDVFGDVPMFVQINY